MADREDRPVVSRGSTSSQLVAFDEFEFDARYRQVMQVCLFNNIRSCRCPLDTCGRNSSLHFF